MKPLIFTSLLLLSSSSFALSCPSVNEINQSIGKVGAIPGDVLSLPKNGFEFPWVYVDYAPHKRKLIETTELVQTSIEAPNGLFCLYEAKAQFIEQPQSIFNNTFIRIINADPNSFKGTSGIWYEGYKGTISTCYDEYGSCQFDRILSR